MNGPEAATLVKEIGIYRLCGSDGCLCMSCAVQGVNIDISCRKSSGVEYARKVHEGFCGALVRVWSRHLDASGDELAAVAHAVVDQIGESAYHVIVRYCDYEHDDRQKCVYCSEPRSDLKGYLCDACLQKPSAFGSDFVRDHYDYRRYEFSYEHADQ